MNVSNVSAGIRPGAKQMKRDRSRREIGLKRRLEIVVPSEHQPLEKTMFTKIKNAMRRAEERSRHRRDYEFLLHQGSNRIFDDVGLTRADVARLYRKTRFM